MGVRRLLRGLFCVCIGLASVSTSFAGTVVALVDVHNRRIVIGADSLDVSSPKGKSERDKKICKIFSTPDCVYGVAGLGSSAGFDAGGFARTACQTPGDLRHKADAFLAISQDALIKFTKEARQNNPVLYSRISNLAKDSRAVLVSVLFAGIEDRAPMVFIRGFRLDENKGSLQPFSMQLGGRRVYAVLGKKGEILAYMKSNPEVETQDVVSVAKTFVQLEINSQSSDVGPPISLLEINQSIMNPNQMGTHWIEQGVCNSDR